MCITPTFKTITVKLVMVEDSVRAPVCPLPKGCGRHELITGGQIARGKQKLWPWNSRRQSKEKDRKREPTGPDSQEEATKCFLLNNLKLVLLMAH